MEIMSLHTSLESFTFTHSYHSYWLDSFQYWSSNIRSYSKVC